MAKRRSEEAGPSTPKKNNLNDGSMLCYVHSVSPLSKKNDTTWFNMTLQTPSEVRRAVSFTPEKQKSFKDMEVAKCGVEITNYDSKNEDIVIKKGTRMKVVGDMPFEHNAKNGSGQINLCLTDLYSLAPEQIISKITLKVVKVEDAMNTDSADKLSIQYVYVADNTSVMKVVLFGEHVDTLNEGKTYHLNNLRLKSYNHER
eukprot:TCONS_00060312-protein